MENNTYGMSAASREQLLENRKMIAETEEMISRVDKNEVLRITLSYGEKVERQYIQKHMDDITQAVLDKYDGFGRFETNKWGFQKRNFWGNGSFYFIWYEVPYICEEWLVNKWNEITGVTGDAVIRCY